MAVSYDIQYKNVNEYFRIKRTASKVFSQSIFIYFAENFDDRMDMMKFVH